MSRSPWLALLSLFLAPLTLGACQTRRAAAALHGGARCVLAPSAIASLSSSHETRGVPEVIRLGDPFGRSALYLKFPNARKACGRAVQAFLTLTPSRAAPSDSSAVSVQAWRVRAAWEPGELRTWAEKPELGPPFANATLSNAPAQQLRIDVTELVRFAAENPERDFGLALLSRTGSGQGAEFATGMAGGDAPRLEIYVR